MSFTVFTLGNNSSKGLSHIGFEEVFGHLVAGHGGGGDQVCVSPGASGAGGVCRCSAISGDGLAAAEAPRWVWYRSDRELTFQTLPHQPSAQLRASGGPKESPPDDFDHCR